jgi:uncharacterized membrane protein YfcA
LSSRLPIILELIYWLYVLVSAAGALLVGVLGTGSSLLLLPSLTLLFTATLPAPDPLRLAAGTTMATIAVGAIAGAIAQYRRGQVDLRLFRLTLLPYIAGGLVGPWLGRLLPGKALGVYVAGVIACTAIMMLRDGARSNRATRHYDAHRLELQFVLLTIGAASSVAGVASGIFAIPYLSRFAIPMRNVIGTSTAAAAVYAVSGALGYVAAGWAVTNENPGVIGFVYLPAFAVMATTALIVTPLGVRLAVKVSDRLLKKGFAVFLLAAAAAMVVVA